MKAVYCHDCIEKFKSWTDLLMNRPLILHNCAFLDLGKVVPNFLHGKCSLFLKSRYESNRLKLILQVERVHTWIPFFLPAQVFCSSYLSHLRTEQKWYPQCISRFYKTLGHGHYKAVRLYRMVVKRKCTYTSKKNSVY